MCKVCLVQTSVGSLSEAKTLVDGLMQQRLCACVQIIASGLSIYRWQGEIEQVEEYYLSIKTNQACQGKLVAWLQEQHPYDLPEITWVIQDSTEQYTEWVHAEVA